MAMSENCKARQARCGGFTMIELLIAFGLMVVLLSTVYIIFDTGSKVFGKSSARLEIMELARTVFHIMERDLNGATVDADGRVFRGYGFAYASSATYGGRKVFGLPGLNTDWRNTSYYLYASYDYNVSYNFSDLLWFRTDSAPESGGGQAEVIYRLACPPQGAGAFTKYYYGGTLERGIRTTWPASSTDPNAFSRVMTNNTDAQNCPLVTSFPPQVQSDNPSDPVMQIIPLAPFCYELRFDFLDAFAWNTKSGQMHRFHDGVSLDSNTTMSAYEVWPPRGSLNPTRGPMSEYRLWSTARLTANECRRHLPAAVKVYTRLGDIRQVVWADMTIDFGSWGRVADGQVQVDEIGMVFEQWFFLPQHVRFPYPD
ncbi:MAG: prepilin-type N-terminal cleavage/methylation domain-containing protein [Planctomycetota bacterium]